MSMSYRVNETANDDGTFTYKFQTGIRYGRWDWERGRRFPIASIEVPSPVELRRQQAAVLWCVVSYALERGEDIKNLEIIGMGHGMIAIRIEVGQLCDEGTWGEAIGRSQWQVFVGPRGGASGYTSSNHRTVRGFDNVMLECCVS